MQAVQFQGIYKVKIDNLPKGEKPINYLVNVSRYLEEELQTDKVELVSNRSYENWAIKPSAHRADTLWYVADDSRGQDYTDFKEARDKAMKLVHKAEDIGDHLPAFDPISFSVSYMLKETGTSLMGMAARLKMTPKNMKLRHEAKVVPLHFEVVQDPKKSRISREMRLVQGTL